MLRLSGCKVNLGLSVIEKRPDGYHNIETVFYPVPWFDVVEIFQANENEIKCYGIDIPGNPNDNYCVKAYQLLTRDFKLPPVKWLILKNIPAGAGLGGGSANAAAAIMLLNKFFSLSLSQEQLMHYASQIGSDCAFFIANKPTYASGRGELLSDIHLSLKNYYILIINPGIHINTAWAYNTLASSNAYSKAGSVLNSIAKPIDQWRYNLKNDFENVVFKAYPQIAELKQKMYDFGAVYSGMSGSGSSVFGLFDLQPDPVSIISLTNNQQYIHYCSKLG
jgi:4-diphosphocytidyl-2-C-methyl-D-erythritol kinase